VAWADDARRVVSHVYNELHHWSGLKLYALQYYINVYTTILPNHLARLGKKEMAYVDILAGAGLNHIQEANDFLPGSTVVAARGPSKPFDFILGVENDVDRSFALKRRLEEIRPPDSFEVIRYDADWHADTIINRLTHRRAHYLAFVDYEGLGGFSWKSMTELLQHDGDVFITFLPGWARVAGRAWEADMDSLRFVVGEELTDKAARAKSLDFLLDGYVKQIRRFRANVVDIPIRSGQAYSYKLIFAAREAAGRSPWMASIRQLGTNLSALTADDVVAAIAEARAAGSPSSLATRLH
jgi:three-Cys-motif partner protein